jgi:proline iminopeptidase
MPMLDVGQGHTLYYETHGNPKGRPIVILHGGPGGGIMPQIKSLFNLKKWYLIQYDQRGCGKSTPRLELKNNTTWHLVEDMEVLRKHLELEKWALYGGSWGTTLALAYASKYLDCITAFVLRGICLFTDEENKWMFEKGYASEVFPTAWTNVTQMLRKDTRKLIGPYTKLLTSKKTRKAAARAWSKYEHNLSYMIPKPFKAEPKSDEESAVLEAYYYKHNAWITPTLLLETAKKIKVPVLLVHGRYDMVCPASSAIQLKEAIPHAKLFLIPNAGHSTLEPGIRKTLKKEIHRLV